MNGLKEITSNHAKRAVTNILWREKMQYPTESAIVKYNKPLVSIVLPNYNHSRFLAQRWQSIINQTFQDFEIIILDDCSSDDSLKLLRTYANHEKVSHFVLNKVNSGSPFKQWKRGIELCQGEYIWVAETDDFSSVDLLESLIEAKNANAVIGFCESYSVNSENAIIGEYLPDSENEHLKLDGFDFIRTAMQCGNGIPNASAVIFRRLEAQQILIPTQMRYCGDWVFWIRLLSKGDAYYVPRRLNYFRHHSASTRPTYSGTGKSFLQSIEKPEYMKEYITGSVEAFYALGKQWDPMSIHAIISQTKLMEQTHPDYKLLRTFPTQMLFRYYKHLFLRKLGARDIVKSIRNLYRKINC